MVVDDTHPKKKQQPNNPPPPAKKKKKKRQENRGEEGQGLPEHAFHVQTVLESLLSLIPLDTPIGRLGTFLDVHKHSEVSIMSFI